MEVRQFPHLEYFQTDLQYVFGFLQHTTDKNTLTKYVAENADQFSDIKDEAYDMIACMSKSEELKLIKRKYQKEEGENVNMCQAIKDMIADGEQRGEQQGIELTKKVFKAKNEGKSNQMIAEECNISLTKVEEILA